MTINNYDQLLASLGAGKQRRNFWWKISAQAADKAGTPQLAWRWAGSPGAGSLPATGAGTIPTNATDGSIKMPNPSGGDLSYFTKFGASGQQAQEIILIDLLWFNSGLSGTLTSVQNINSTALTRNTSGLGNQIGAICWTATGATAANVTVNYTDDTDTARSSISTGFFTGIGGYGTTAPTADQLQIIPLNDASYGVKSIQSAQLSGTTGTAGNWGLCIFKAITRVYHNQHQYVERDMVIQTASLPTKEDNACLTIIRVPSATTTLQYTYGQIINHEG